MFTHIKRGGMALTAVLTALLLTLGMASAVSAHTDGTQHDDANGHPAQNASGTDLTDVTCTSSTQSVSGTSHCTAHPGSGGIDSVANDSPADAVNVIRDYGLENAPIIVGVIGAIFLVGLTFYLIRRGLMKARGAMRL